MLQYAEMTNIIFSMPVKMFIKQLIHQCVIYLLLVFKNKVFNTHKNEKVLSKTI